MAVMGVEEGEGGWGGMTEVVRGRCRKKGGRGAAVVVAFQSGGDVVAPLPEEEGAGEG